jgi:radical SAM protein with 4Fe4S-binding SPASM domain
VRKTIDYIKELEKEGASIYTPVDPEEEWPEYFVCAGGLTRATVENNGTLGGCQFMMGKLGPTGTVMKEGLTKLWQEGDFSVFREGTREPTLECKECEDRAYCVAGCLAFDLGLEEQGRVCPNK